MSGASIGSVAQRGRPGEPETDLPVVAIAVQGERLVWRRILETSKGERIGSAHCTNVRKSMSFTVLLSLVESLTVLWDVIKTSGRTLNLPYLPDHKPLLSDLCCFFVNYRSPTRGRFDTK